jgi:hypothetical protein
VYYRINVSKLYKKDAYGTQHTHFFATAPESIINMHDCAKTVKVFTEKFPAPEYKISVQRIVSTSTDIDLDEVASWEK